MAVAPRDPGPRRRPEVSPPAVSKVEKTIRTRGMAFLRARHRGPVPADPVEGVLPCVAPPGCRRPHVPHVERGRPFERLDDRQAVAAQARALSRPQYDIAGITCLGDPHVAPQDIDRKIAGLFQRHGMVLPYAEVLIELSLNFHGASLMHEWQAWHKPQVRVVYQRLVYRSIGGDMGRNKRIVRIRLMHESHA